ncbi:MAG: response regulator [Mucilaginibacter sp.]
MTILILLVEDNEDLRENIAEILFLDGFNVITADCGAEALNLAEEHLPDLIICDIMMPGMDGYTVFKTLNHNRLTYHIPFIFSTAMSENSEKKKAKALGIKNYLVKPFDETELLKCVNKALRFRSIKSKPSLSIPFASIV